MVKKLSWDLKTNFLYFKEYWSNEDVLHDFLVDNLQGDIDYPFYYGISEEEITEKQQEFFTDIVYSLMEIITRCLDNSRSYKDFKKEFIDEITTKHSRDFKSVSKMLEYILLKLIEEFVAKG
ncbi:MAG: hypothetical protein WC346_21800 [Methanogenium sp.]|jgi:hypothetical protein